MDKKNKRKPDMEALFEFGEQDLLRMVICGSVDDGKSTLVGRLLWERGFLYGDQKEALEADSRAFGTQGADIDFALLTDGLSAEREQGITIDVAYRFFSTRERRFIVADTPGHEEYTRNMVTGASNSELAVLLVDISKGLSSQTKRHALLASLIGVRHIVLAINKMDLVSFRRKKYDFVCAEFKKFAKSLGFASVVSIPMSALKGDNIEIRSNNTPWYEGPSFMEYLEDLELNSSPDSKLRLPIQWVNRRSENFRGYSGTLVSGLLNVGDELIATKSKKLSTVQELITPDGSVSHANPGTAITVKLMPEIDLSRGDVLTHFSDPLNMTNQFEATIFWLAEDEGLQGRTYDLKLSTQRVSASITKIKYVIDVNTLSHTHGDSLFLNDVAVCNLALSEPLVFEKYEQCKEFGSFVLIDRFTQSVIGGGMIRHSLRRVENIFPEESGVERSQREKLNGHRGQVVWFTGLSGSGKSTLARALEKALYRQGKRTYVLDGDNIRGGLNKDLGFTYADRVENNRRLAEVSKLMLDAGIIVITAFISPFALERETAKDSIGAQNFTEVYVSTPIQVCEERDVKGLYRKARSGELPNLSGIGSPFEPPVNPALKIDTSQVSVEDSVSQLLHLLGERDKEFSL